MLGVVSLISTVSVVTVVVAIIAFALQVHAHTYVTAPPPRNYPYPQDNCRVGGPTPETQVNCPGPCNQPYSPTQAHNNVARGDPLTVQWPRNNHPGGFVRLAWIKEGQAETHAEFEKGIQLYACHEVSCQSDAGPGNDGGDTNGIDGTRNPCRTVTNVPTWLSDGRWTLQWSWWGGAFGHTGDYYSCMNFRVNGGAALTTKPAVPYFQAGDVSNPGGDKCEYWTTNAVGYCWREPCETYCDDNTAPAGHCGWPAANGQPYIPARVKPLTTAGTCRTYTPGDLPRRIPLTGTSGPSTSTVNVPDSFTISRIRVRNIQGTHSWHGSLEVYLYAPSGEYVTLASTRCTDSSTGPFSFSFSEDASSRNMPCPMNTGGTWWPIDHFGYLWGSNSQGNWRLVIEDREDGIGTGQLNQWALELCEEAGTTPPPALTTSVNNIPATSTSSSTSTSGDDVVDITVKVTVALQTSPNTLDVTTFIYDVTSVLDLPLFALSSVQVDFDQSTTTETIVTFIISNAAKNDGTRVDPVAAAAQLKALADGNDARLRGTGTLNGMRYVSSENLSSPSDESFIKSTNFIIVVSVVGGVVLLSVIAITIAVVVRKRKGPGFY